MWTKVFSGLGGTKQRKNKRLSMLVAIAEVRGILEKEFRMKFDTQMSFVEEVLSGDIGDFDGENIAFHVLQCLTPGTQRVGTTSALKTYTNQKEAVKVWRTLTHPLDPGIRPSYHELAIAAASRQKREFFVNFSDVPGLAFLAIYAVPGLLVDELGDQPEVVILYGVKREELAPASPLRFVDVSICWTKNNAPQNSLFPFVSSALPDLQPVIPSQVAKVPMSTPLGLLAIGSDFLGDVTYNPLQAIRDYLDMLDSGSALGVTYLGSSLATPVPVLTANELLVPTIEQSRSIVLAYNRLGIDTEYKTGRLKTDTIPSIFYKESLTLERVAIIYSDTHSKYPTDVFEVSDAWRIDSKSV